MTPKGQGSAKKARTMIMVLAVAVVVGLAVASVSTANGHERLKMDRGAAAASLAEVTATFSEDGTGFNVTSDKDLSNIIIEYCADSEKLEFGDGNVTYDHAGNATVTGIWVKSGSYSDPDGPPGAGYRFDNASAACATEPEA